MKSTLVARFPDVAKQWHPTKNGDLKPEHFSHGSNKKVWWRCDGCSCGRVHDRDAKISRRTTGGTGCNVCRTNKAERELAEWAESHPTVCRFSKRSYTIQDSNKR